MEDSGLRKLTGRESEDRLVLAQTVSYLLSESVDALVGKAVVLLDDFKLDLADWLGALVDRWEVIVGVVGFEVAYEEQGELRDGVGYSFCLDVGLVW